MIIGVDFDNTIVCYDQLFYRVACEKGLIPPETAQNKKSIRDYLRKTGREELWTEMQGYVYGPRIEAAEPYPGVIDFFKYCNKQSISIYIISHKTKEPFIGPKYDLHDFAITWLLKYGIVSEDSGIAIGNVHFELTKQDKLARIAQMQCNYFIDDLPEFLLEKDFPEGVRRILFDPNYQFNRKQKELHVVSGWREIQNLLVDSYGV